MWMNKPFAVDFLIFLIYSAHNFNSLGLKEAL